MSDFGDVEPEDAWDPGDTVDELLANVVRRVALLVLREHILDALADLVRAERRDRVLDEAERRRADLIDEDIVFIRGRL